MLIGDQQASLLVTKRSAMSIKSFVVITILSFCGTAYAQEGAPVPAGDVDVPPGENVIVVLQEGARAPFTGQLFDQATALRWGNRTVRYRMRIHLLEEELQVCHTEREASTERQLQIVEASYTREIEGLRTDLRDQAARYEAELARFRDPPFYETWGFAFGMGALATAVVVAVIGALVIGL